MHKFSFNNSFLYNNLLRKWSKLCISFDVDRNEVRAAFNGRVSHMVRRCIKKYFYKNICCRCGTP